MCVIKGLDNYVENKKELCEINDSIDRSLFGKYGVKRGLRDEKGQGVLTGLTNISHLGGTRLVDGVKVPTDGTLFKGLWERDLFLKKLPTYCYSASYLIVKNWMNLSQ